MQKRKRTGLAAGALTGVLFFLTAAAAVSAWMTESETINSVSTGSVSGTIEEEFEQDKEYAPGAEVEKNVKVKNTGTVDSMVRVKLTKQWGSGRGEDGRLIEDTGISTDNIVLNFEQDTAWTLMDDGWYYYAGVLEPGKETDALISGFTIDAEKTGNEYKNMHADIKVKMQCIQAGGNAMEAVWEVSYDDLDMSYQEDAGSGLVTTAEFISPEDGFIFEVNDGDLFANFKDLVPGMSRSQEVEVINGWSQDVAIGLYADRAGQGEDLTAEELEKVAELLEKYITIEITAADALTDAGSELLYAGNIQGNLDAADDAAAPDTMRDVIGLGTFAAGETKTFHIALSVAKEMADEYAGLLGNVTWCFVAEGEYPDDEPEESDEPQDPVKEVTGTTRGDEDGAIVYPGDQIEYEIRYYNHHKTAADITVTDHLDDNVTYVGSDPAGAYDEETHSVTWTIKNAAAQEWGAVKLTVQVNDELNIKLLGKTYIENQAGVQIGNEAEVFSNTTKTQVEEPEPDEPLNPRKTVDENSAGGLGGSAVKAGDQITYKIEYYNHHSTDQTVIIVDQLDAGVKYAGSDPQGTYDEEHHTVTWTIEKAAAQEWGAVTLTVEVTAEAQGIIRNQAEAEMDGVTSESNEVEHKTETDDEPRNPEKTVTDMTSQDKIARPGDRIEYEISYYNHHMEAADVTVTDYLDNNVSYAGGDPEGTYDAATHTVSWIIKDVPAKSWGTITLTVQVNETIEGISVDNIAGVQVDNDSETESEIVSIPAEEPEPEEPRNPIKYYDSEGDVSSGSTVKAGDQITYGISYYNHHATEQTVIVRDELDPGVNYVSSEPEGTYDEKTHTVTWTIEKATAQEWGTVTLTVEVTKDAKSSISNQVEVDLGEVTAESNELENEVETDDEPEVPQKEIGYTTSQDDTVRPGDLIEYEISYYNHHAEAADVTVADYLDHNVSVYAIEDGGIYDETRHVVTWKLAEVPGKTGGSVKLVVQVNENISGGSIDNTAGVQVDNDSETESEVVTIPAKEPEPEEERTPVKYYDSESGISSGSTVKAGEQITYLIDYYNENEDVAQVVITDHLDQNVNYVSSDPEGTYDEDSHTVTWTIRNAEAQAWGQVSLTVEVAEDASGSISNQAEVNVDGEPAESNELENKVGPDDKEPDDNSGDDNPTVPEKDLSYTTSQDGYVRPGDLIEYEIGYYNHHAAAADVTVTDYLDRNVSYVSSEPEGTYDKESHTVTWKLEKVTGKTSGTVKLTVQVNETIEGISVDNIAGVQVDNDSETESEVVSIPAEELEPEKERNPIKYYDSEGDVSSGSAVKAGEQITYLIDYYNDADTAQTVIVRDELDQNVNYVSSEPEGSYDEDSHTVTWTIRNAEAQAWGQVSLTVEVAEDASGSIRNQAEVDVNGETSGSNELEDPTEPEEGSGLPGGNIPGGGTGEPVVPEKEVTYTTSQDGIVRPGDLIEYEIGYYNHLEEAADVTITDYLDENVSVYAIEDGGIYDESRHVVVWTIEAVSGKTGGSVKLVVQVNENVSGGRIDNTAGVQVGDGDETSSDIVFVPAENTRPEEERSPIKYYDSESGISSGSTVKAGDRITYTIDYYNDQEEKAEVTIRDELDPGVKYVSSSPRGIYDEDSHTVTWTIRKAEAQTWGQVSLTVEVTEDASGSITNRAEVDVNGGISDSNELENPTEPEEGSGSPGGSTPGGSTGEPVVPEKVVAYTTSQDGTVRPGDLIEYEISYYNHLEEKADITVTDYLDENVSVYAIEDGGVYDADRHVVTWTIKKAAGQTGGSVKLVVQVNENISGERIDNTAGVQVGDGDETSSDIVFVPAENTRPEEERSPIKYFDSGSGTSTESVVKDGDRITYRIAYYNHLEEAADILITDRLDSGVKYVSSEPEGTYEEENHAVTWTVPDAAAQEWGYVTLTVEVAEEAQESIRNTAWMDLDGETYGSNELENKVEPDEDSGAVGGNTPGGGTEEPVVPEKVVTYTTSQDGTVRPGDLIEYEISYYNHHEKKADITVTDYLDENVSVYAIEDGGIYDETSHVITWTIKKVPGQTGGSVRLVVQVNENINGERIDNTAGVQVGDGDETSSDIVFVPAEDPEPGVARNPIKYYVSESGLRNGSEVKAGDQITYRIAYYNHLEEAAAITITDELDDGVTYVSSSPEGTYEEEAHTVTWTAADAVAQEWGYMTLTVEVAEDAKGSISNLIQMAAGGEIYTSNTVDNEVAERSGGLLEQLKERLTADGSGTATTTTNGTGNTFTTATTPKTGDMSRAWMYTAAAVISLILFMLTSRRRQRRKVANR